MIGALREHGETQAVAQDNDTVGAAGAVVLQRHVDLEQWAIAALAGGVVGGGVGEAGHDVAVEGGAQLDGVEVTQTTSTGSKAASAACFPIGVRATVVEPAHRTHSGYASLSAR